MPAVALVGLLGTSVWLGATADEGMWTFDNPPRQQLAERYGFAATSEWLEHARLSTVRINDGGSGSFVSPRGLVMTNHHVALGQIQNLSREGVDYTTTGFYAPSHTDELKTPDLEINVLVSMVDVTARVRGAVSPDADERQALADRQAEIARLEKESLDATGMRSNVVSLYQGGEFWLYRYTRYTDVRLVFAPESQAAFFGGDSDNFTYPRYCLDVAFFRVYENDEPADTTHFLRFNPAGPAKDELIFVVGNPGSTDRLKTIDQLTYERDVRHPALLSYFETYEALLRAYGDRGIEQTRQINRQLLGVTNSKKAYRGQLRGLTNDTVWQLLERRDQEFRARVADTPFAEDAVHAWDAIARAAEAQGQTFEQRLYRGFIGSTLAEVAGIIVRYVVETAKPDGERLPGYHDSELDALELRLFSPAPIYQDLEEHVIVGFLLRARERLGSEDPFVHAVLGDRSPEQVAAALVRNTELASVHARRALVDGGQAAVAASRDPFIAVMRQLDPERRADQEWYRREVESVLEDAGATLARARFATYGKTVHPDATFTPRLAYGTASGYPMNGTRAPYQTTLYGLYGRALAFGQTGEYALPDRFWQRRDRLDLSTPVNFVSTADIIGGNSGSPVINRAGELVGLIFDGNIESLVGAFAYDDQTARAISVHPAYILEALTKLYDAEPLAQELTAR